MHPPGFEPGSKARKALMIGHYTTGASDGGRIRTANNAVNSRVLYQLNYPVRWQGPDLNRWMPMQAGLKPAAVS